MYNQDRFIELLKKCQGTNSLNEFAKLSNVDSGYLSRILNKKKTNPPSPSILKKISLNFGNIVTYEELMEACGYFTGRVNNSLFDSYNYSPIPIFSNIDEYYEYDNLLKDKVDEQILLDSAHHTYLKIKLSDNRHNYFAYISQDDSMSPLLCKGDIAIIKKSSTYEEGNTCLIFIDDETLFVRKIKEKEKYLELHTIMQTEDVRIILKSDFEKRNFKILGKVIKVENESAFK